MARALETSQNAIYRLENPNYGRPNISTLKKLADYFGVGLVVRFAPFSELVEWTLSMTPASIDVPSFEDDVGFIERKESGLATVGGPMRSATTAAFKETEQHREEPASVPAYPGISAGTLYSLNRMQSAGSSTAVGEALNNSASTSPVAGEITRKPVSAESHISYIKPPDTATGSIGTGLMAARSCVAMAGV